jgi:hypothetical protein
MGLTGGTYGILVGSFERKKLIWRPKYNMKMILLK